MGTYRAIMKMSGLTVFPRLSGVTRFGYLKVKEKSPDKWLKMQVLHEFERHFYQIDSVSLKEQVVQSRCDEEKQRLGNFPSRLWGPSSLQALPDTLVLPSLEPEIPLPRVCSPNK